MPGKLPCVDERLREHSDWRGEILIPPRTAAVPEMQARIRGRVATSLRGGTEGQAVPDGSFRRRVRVAKLSAQSATKCSIAAGAEGGCQTGHGIKASRGSACDRQAGCFDIDRANVAVGAFRKSLW